MSDGNDLLGKTARPWAKWPAVGAVVTGTVIDAPSARQSRNFESGEPDTWPNGDPKMEVVVPLATSERDPEIEDDDGERSLVLPVGSARFKAVQAAMKRAGVKALAPGGVIAVRYTKDGPKPKGSKLNAPKEFSAEYTPPAGVSEQDALAALGGLIK
jgi:hypothetical protein